MEFAGIGRDLSGPYQLNQYYSQQAFDREFRAATTERPGSTSEEMPH
jgi:hypothetical protein